MCRYWSDRRQVQKQNSSSAASRGGPAAGLDGSLSKRMSQLEAQDNIEVRCCLQQLHTQCAAHA